MTAPPDPSSLQALQQRYGERHRWLLLFTVMVGTMAAIMSSTIINVAIPDMSAHFGLGPVRAQWVSSGFMAAMTVSMLTTPWLLMRHGYRRLYAACMWLMLAGGLIGGASDQFGIVLAARVAEGLAAGVVQPIPGIIILRAFEPHEQGRASGIFGMGVVLAPAVGPSIGGLLVDGFGWRSIFFMVVPVCLACLWLARRYVPTSAPGGLRPGEDRTPLDWAGLVLGSAATLCLLNGLTQWRDGGLALGLPLLAGAALLIAAFITWQHRLAARGGAPLMRLAIFGFRRFAMGSIVAFIYGAALFGSTYLLPVYLQSGLGLSASHVGALLLPAGLVLAVVIAGVGRLADRQPTHVLVSTGLALLALSFALMPTVGSAQAMALLVTWTILGRIGLGFVLPSLNLGSMRGVSRELIPQGSSTINFVRMLGGATGISLCAIALEWRLAARGEHRMPAGTGAAPMDLGAFNEVFLMLAAVCALALAAAWQLRDHPAPKEP